MKRLNKLLKWLLIGFAVLFGLSIILVAILALAVKSNTKNDTGSVSSDSTQRIEVAVKGNSMAPTISNGDIIYYEPKSNPKVNDLVVVHCDKCFANKDDDLPENKVVKRLVAIDDKNCYTLRGDNPSLSNDSRYYGVVCPNERSNVGVVTEIIHKDGSVTKTL